MGIFLFFNLIILTIIITNVLSQNECPKYECSQLGEEKICSKFEKDQNSFYLQECNHTYYCDWTNSEEKKSQCKISSYEYNEPAYPGGACSKNTDCMGKKKCDNNMCVGSKEGENCNDHSDCIFGLYCNSEKQCISLKKENDDCIDDYECPFDTGCYKNKCTSYFSIKDNMNIESENQYFCESMKIWDKKCVKFSRTNTETCILGDSCEYTDDQGKTYLIPNTCKCTISTEPTTRCQMMNGDQLERLAQIKDLFSKVFLQTKCNAGEKRLNFCRESLRNDWDYRKYNINLIRLLTEFENSAIITPEVSCALKTVFKFDDTPPKPKNGIFKCPSYNCPKRKDEFNFDNFTCAYSINPFNEKGENISVYLQKICPEGTKCNYNIDNTNGNWTYNSTCKEIPTSQTWKMKYPGEQCISHEQCHNGSEKTIGFCIDGVCSGRQKDENCTNHGDCVKGYFCNGLYCERQKGENNFCLESYECLNYLGCLNNTCKPYNSLSNGTYLNATNPDKTLCEMEKINKGTNQCAELSYYDVSEERLKDGFVECEPGQLCNYTTGFYDKNGKLEVETALCTCGYNDNGKAYCPLPQTQNTKDWKKYYSAKNKLLDNDCHTLRRKDCSDEISAKQMDELYYYERKTIKAHLFKDASDCVIEILNTNYLKFNIGVTLSAILFLLM